MSTSTHRQQLRESGTEPAKCPVCETGSYFDGTKVSVAGGDIYTCRQCEGYFLHPPKVVEYDNSEWTSARDRQWDSDVARGRHHALRIAEWFRKRYGSELTSVLEIGCGSAFLAPGFVNHGIAYSGIDVDATSIDRARDRGIDARLVAAEQIAAGELGHLHFDLILSSNTFEHVASPRDAFLSLGKMNFTAAVIIVPNPQGFLPRIKAWKLIRRVIQKHLRTSREIIFTIDGHWHNLAYSRRSIEYLCGVAGLKITTLKTIGINDCVFGFVQPNPSVAYRLASSILTALDQESQLVLVAEKE